MGVIRLKNLLKRTRAIIFDLDGVILDSIELSILNVQAIARRQGLRVPNRDELTESFGLFWAEAAKKLWHGCNPEKIKGDVIKINKSRRYPFIANVIPAMYQLKKAGFILTILTNRENKTFFYHTKNTAVLDNKLFRLIQRPDNNPFKKPDPKAFDQTLSFLQKFNISKRQVVFVGDTIYDAQAAQAAQIEFIGVLTGAATEERFKKLNVKYIIKSAADLPKFIQSN